MNLKSFVGKICLLQLSSSYICPTAKDGKITVLYIQTSNNPNPSILPIPFILGELNHSEEDGYSIKYFDESSNMMIDVAFNLREVITISKVSDKQISKLIIASAS